MDGKATEERARLRLRRIPRVMMEKHDIERLREKVSCAVLLENAGWKVDEKESTRRAVKFRRGEGEIIIVIHDGRGWFDPLSTRKGDVFDLAERLGAAGFVEACESVASLIGFHPTSPVWQRPLKVVPMASIRERWQRRFTPRIGSPTWQYLSQTRLVPDDVVGKAADQGCVREGPHGSLWAAHTDDAGNVVGWEERGPQWRGFAKDGSKILFRFGSPRAWRVCIAEAAIDAMSLAAIEVLRSDTLYVSTGGGWAPATEEAVRRLATRPGTLLVAATDNNRQGDVYAERVRDIATQAHAHYARSRPRADDWNEDLKGLAARLERQLVVEHGQP